MRDPQLFRSELGKHNALVSGSVALQFFERVVWRESDLDVFIEEGENAGTFHKYLTEKEYYKLNTTAFFPGYMMSDIEQVKTYTRKSKLDSTELKVQIILTRCIPVQAILKGFYSTVVVNIIAWNKAYAIFPLLTFVHHKGYMLKPQSDHYTKPLEKYSGRGWRFQEAMSPEDRIPNQPIQQERRVGDEFTWMISFDTSNVKWSKTPDLVLEYANFMINNINQTARQKHYTIESEEFVSEVLRYRYLRGGSTSTWMFFLGEKVDELTRLELLKMAPEARPAGFQGEIAKGTALYRCMTGCEKPDGWTYSDDQIPKWYESWRQSEMESKKD